MTKLARHHAEVMASMVLRSHQAAISRSCDSTHRLLLSSKPCSMHRQVRSGSGVSVNYKVKYAPRLRLELPSALSWLDKLSRKLSYGSMFRETYHRFVDLVLSMVLVVSRSMKTGCAALQSSSIVRIEGERFMRLKLAIGTLLGVSVGCAPVVTALAQEIGALEEIIVTAQKREESIQDVPIAVSAFSASALEEQRLDGAYDLQNAVPNLVFSGCTGSTPNFNIRGVGSANGVGSTGDSGVLPHHNNVPLTVSRVGVADFYDVERVEVLRGPQGTLYGRNATGGVLNVITAKPDLSNFNASTALEYAD